MIPHALHGLTCVERFYSYPSAESTEIIAQSIKKKPQRGFFIVQADILNKKNNEIGYNGPDGLWVSIVNSNGGLVYSILIYNQIISVAIISSLSKIIKESELSIEWPSYILCSGKRIAYVSAELHTSFPDVIIYSFNLNVNVGEDKFFEGSNTGSTSLFIESGRTISKGELLKSIIEKFKEYLSYDFEEIRRIYTDHLYKRNCLVDAGGIRGILDGVDENGFLCLKNENGTVIIENQIKIDYNKDNY